MQEIFCLRIFLDQGLLFISKSQTNGFSEILPYRTSQEKDQNKTKTKKEPNQKSKDEFKIVKTRR